MLGNLGVYLKYRDNNLITRKFRRIPPTPLLSTKRNNARASLTKARLYYWRLENSPLKCHLLYITQYPREIGLSLSLSHSSRRNKLFRAAAAINVASGQSCLVIRQRCERSATWWNSISRSSADGLISAISVCSWERGEGGWQLTFTTTQLYSIMQRTDAGNRRLARFMLVGCVGLFYTTRAGCDVLEGF